MTRGWPSFVASVQPGNGVCARAAQALGRWRRWWLRWCRPAHVRRLQVLRTGDCPGCAHDVVDPRDTLWVQNVCGWRWAPPLAVSAFRDRFGLVRLGRADVVGCCVFGGGAAVLVGAVSPWLAALPLLLPAFALWFFRDPERCAPADPDLVLAPADGVLDDVRREAECPFFAGPAWRLGIYLSLFDVHVNRAPVHGTAQRFDYRRGRRVATRRAGATDENEQLVTWFAARRGGLPVVVRQIAGPAARRICNVLGAGDVVAAGQRFGLIKFGSRTELWLPCSGLELLAAKGQRVVGGVTVVGRLR